MSKTGGEERCIGGEERWKRGRDIWTQYAPRATEYAHARYPVSRVELQVGWMAISLILRREYS